MIALWVLHPVLIPCSSSIANELLFCEHYSVDFHGVNGCINLQHVLNSMDENCTVPQLVAAIVEWLNSGVLCRYFDRKALFRSQRLSCKETT
jgi:hypothetical protein